MNVDAPLEASAQLAEGGQPGVCALDDPAMAPKSVVALNAFAGDAVLDATSLEVRVASRVVVTLVRMQLAGPATWPATLARHRWQGVDQLVENYRVMPIGPGNAEHHRDALAVRDEVAFAAQFSPVRGVGACE